MKSNKSEAEKRLITVYWWNFGKKTLDFRGTYRDFFLRQDITSRSVKTGGYVFIIPLSSSVTTFRTTDTDYERGASEAIRIFMTLLGDKAKIETPNQEYKVNWR